MSLSETWTLRNTIAKALEQTLEVLERDLLEATHEERIEFIDGFMPNRSPAPEWTASFERLVELIWRSLPKDSIKAIEQEYENRPGPMWKPIARKFSNAEGENIQANTWHPTGARKPAVILR